MGKIKLYFLLLVVSVGFSGCWIFFIPPEQKTKLTYCFDNDYTGLDTILNIDGYFLMCGMSSRNLRFSHYCKFFPNGMYVSNGGSWGIYEFFGDTIKIQEIDIPGSMSRTTSQTWFKIISMDTIKMIYSGTKEKVTNKDLNEFAINPLNQCRIFIFRPIRSDIDPNKSWLIKKRWFWCNKEQYKAWKKEQREKRRNNK